MSSAILNGLGTALADVENMIWVLSGCAIAGTVSVAAVGKLSDIFGRRYMMLLGNFFALIGSVSVS